MAEKLFTRDSAVIFSELLDEDGVNPLNISGATWELVSPSGAPLLLSALPPTPEDGQTVGLLQDAAPFSSGDIVQWDGDSWNLLTDELAIEVEPTGATLIVPGALTNEAGLYRGRVQFTTTDGVKRSNQVTFETVDPIYTGSTDNPDYDLAIDRAWMKLEDLFDSELGGPWLRDETLANFDRAKLLKLAPDAMYGINNSFQPSTGFTNETFPYSGHGPLFSQAVLVEAIMHLMRSYVEQPTPNGEPITWFDRRDYLQRWQTVLQIEVEKLNNWLMLFKNEMFAFGKSSSMLVGGYSGYFGRHPRYIRGPMPWIPRF